MDILMLNPFFYPYAGGTEKHILEVGKRLAKKHNISVLTARLENTQKKEYIDGIEVIRTDAKILYKLPHPLPPPMAIMPNLKKDLKKQLQNSDALHIHNRFVYGPDIGKIAKQMQKKLFLTIHNSRTVGIDLITDFFGCLWDDLIAKKLMNMCDGIAAVSKDALIQTIPKNYSGKTSVIYNGIDEKIFRPKKPSGWEEYFEKNNITKTKIFTNARLLPQKGIKYLIEALSGMDLDLIILGRGPLKEKLERQAKNLKVNLHFISQRISEEELVNLYNSIDIFVLPSLYEPCGIALLEAMGCGKASIASRIGGMKEIIEDKKSGLLVSPGSPSQIKEAIKTILENKDIKRNLEIQARKRVLKEFTWGIVTKKLERFYHE